MIARFAIPFALFMGVVVVPLLLFLLCRWLLPRRWGRRVGAALAVAVLLTVVYGTTVGFSQLRVQQVTFTSADLPQTFDGYRIVQFSDAHVGTMTGLRKWMLERAVDSILAQHADMIVFTGDLQNLSPDELTEHLPQLHRLRAPDGMYSVLGNHDYDIYQRHDSATQQRCCRQTQRLERSAGWTLLMNDHRTIRRGQDSIVVAGMENWGSVKRMPRRGDVAATLRGVDSTAFVLMLQHDPTAWRAKILPESRAQLTLSGHTHGGQVELLGLSPAAFMYDEWGGTTREGRRALHVSTGLGGLIPFRLGLPGEIVVITLRSRPAGTAK